jgi:hypothetical protein
MANGNLPAPDKKDAKLDCRLVSLRPDVADATDDRTESLRIAAVVAMVVLLGFACIGVVFTLQHRRPKSEDQSATEIAQNRLPASATAPLRPKVSVPIQQVPVEKPPPSLHEDLPSVPVQPLPANADAEVLSVLPRARGAENESDQPPLVIGNKPRFDPMGETTRAPNQPVTSIQDVPKEKPIVQPSRKLPDTEPAIDSRLTTFGTRIGFYPSAVDAFEAARKDSDKLVLVMHYGGLFEDGAFKSDAVEQFRRDCLLDPDVAAAIQREFVCSHMKVGPSRHQNGRNTGSVVAYFCLSNGKVLHAIAGPVQAEQFLRELDWLQETRKTAAAEYLRDRNRYAAVFKKAHTQRYFGMVGDDPLNPVVNQLPKTPIGPDARTKVHWLLGYQPLPELKDISRRIYADFLKESLTP